MAEYLADLAAPRKICCGDDCEKSAAKNGDVNKIAERDVALLMAVIRDPRLSRRHLHVASALLEASHGAMDFRVTASDIASRIGRKSFGSVQYSSPTVSRVFGDFVRWGYLSHSRRAVSPGGRAVSHYRFLHTRQSAPEARQFQRVRKRRRPSFLLRQDMLAQACEVFGWTCEYCGCSVHAKAGPYSSGQRNLDRIHPGARGGHYTPENVTLSCAKCNSTKRAGDFVGPVRSLSIMLELHGRQK